VYTETSVNQSRRNCKCARELAGQNTNQPKREFLENGENREIRKMNNKQTQNAENKNYPKIPPKENKVRNSRIQNKTAQVTATQERNPIKTHAKRRV